MLWVIFTQVKWDAVDLTVTWCTWLGTWVMGPSALFLGLPLSVFTQGCMSMAFPDSMAYIYSCAMMYYSWLCNSLLVTVSVYGGISQTVLAKKGKEKGKAP